VNQFWPPLSDMRCPTGSAFAPEVLSHGLIQDRDRWSEVRVIHIGESPSAQQPHADRLEVSRTGDVNIHGRSERAFGYGRPSMTSREFPGFCSFNGKVPAAAQQ